VKKAHFSRKKTPKGQTKLGIEKKQKTPLKTEEGMADNRVS